MLQTRPDMILLLMCVMMKILEYSSGTLIDVQEPATADVGNLRTRKKKRRRPKKGLAGLSRGMTTEEKIGTLHSPESDCNSNTVDSTTSYLSNTSSQDVDFIQDNSDYQWFLDYGYYRETQHRSILSLSTSYEEGCYDDIARDLDTQLAQVDMEDFRAEDILSTLPTICCQELQPERRGEMFASVSGSMMDKFDLDCFLSPQSFSQEGEGESMCKSGPLFSPVRECPLRLTGPNFSVDSLDCGEQNILLTCQANKDNYTIAFEGSTLMGEDIYCHHTESNTSGTGSGSCTWSSDGAGCKMASYDQRTTWHKVVSLNNHRNSCMRHSTASLPNLTRSHGRLHQSSTTSDGLGGLCVKLYDVQHSSPVSSSDNTLSSDRQHSKLSLVRLFIKQRGCTMAHSDCAPTHRSQTDLCNNSVSRSNKNLFTSDRNQNQVSTWVDQTFADSLIDEVPESESVEKLSESISLCSCEASLNTCKQLSGNNNNSVERCQMGRTTQTRTSLASSSSSDPTEVTKISIPAHVRNSSIQCPLNCVDASMQTSATICGKKCMAKTKPPIYVMYPNYTLPDLAFLRDDKLDLDQVFLTPFKFSPGTSPLPSPTTKTTRILPTQKRQRPYSCIDIEHLRKKGFSHIKDWESLATLLPPEYCTLLSEVPEFQKYKDLNFHAKPLFCMSPLSSKVNSTQFTTLPEERTTVTSSAASSTATQPSSGYRGSSTLLTDSSANPSPAPHMTRDPLFIYHYESIGSNTGSPIERKSAAPSDEHNDRPPPRPPLPRGILRNSLENAKLHKNQANKKRHSMFDMETVNLNDPELERKYDTKFGGLTNYPLDQSSETDVLHSLMPQLSDVDRLHQMLAVTEAEWEEFRRTYNSSPELWSGSRDCGDSRKTVSFADKRKETAMTPPNSPQTSVVHNYQVKPRSALSETIAEEEVGFTRGLEIKRNSKADLVGAVCVAASKLISHAQSSSTETFSNIVLNSLCPALNSLLNDGLKPLLETAFGDVLNSVWQLVETSTQQGPITKPLSELVFKINSEDVLTEGIVKFNAFIFGLLNVQGLTVWLKYLRTRESVLRRHFTVDAVMLSACRGQPDARLLMDKLIDSLTPLAQLSLRLDMFYETKLLHQSLQHLTKFMQSASNSGSGGSSKGSWTMRRLLESASSPLAEIARPRSCVDSVNATHSTDIAATAHKRWSGVNMGGKFSQAFDKLIDNTEEEYTDSLEAGIGKNKNTVGGEESNGKFRRLQMKWEMLSGKENTSQESSPNTSPVKSCAPKSRIPRPVMSPVRSSRPPIKRPLTTTQFRRPTILPGTTRPKPSEGPIKFRTSRVDAPTKTGPVARPSSLPYRPQRAPDSHRRAVSSSTSRQPSGQHSPPHKYVVTLSHRLPSDSGHLAYNEGERLRLVLEVDDTWLLCCRGDAKGLVPRSGVLLHPSRI